MLRWSVPLLLLGTAFLPLAAAEGDPPCDLVDCEPTLPISLCEGRPSTKDCPPSALDEIGVAVEITTEEAKRLIGAVSCQVGTPGTQGNCGHEPWHVVKLCGLHPQRCDEIVMEWLEPERTVEAVEAILGLVL